MIKTNQERTRFEVSGKRLRRAKRLYHRLVHIACVSDASGEILTLCVNRSIESGLYSVGTGERQVRWSFMRAFWRLTDLPEFNNKNFGWYAFIKSNWYLFDESRRGRFEQWSNQKAA